MPGRRRPRRFRWGRPSPRGWLVSASRTWPSRLATSAPRRTVRPRPGVITNWNVRGGNGGPGQASLKVFRETGPGQFVTVDQTAATPVPANALVAVSGLHIRVQAGDLLGSRAMPRSRSRRATGCLATGCTAPPTTPSPARPRKSHSRAPPCVSIPLRCGSPTTTRTASATTPRTPTTTTTACPTRRRSRRAPNPLDPDTDGDGLPDGSDPRPLSSDRDHDGIDDIADNCAADANPDQANADGDHPG